MGLLGKLAKALGKPSESAPSSQADAGREIQALNRDGRLHSRYSLLDSVATIQLADGRRGVIKDISYGGVAARFQSEGEALTEKSIAGDVTGELSIFGHGVGCRLTLVRTVLQNPRVLYAGFAMRHDTPDTLIFLRTLIEPLRCASTLAELQPAVRNERYRDPAWLCLRGEGPIDLILRRDERGGIAEGLLTFRSGDGYCELSCRDGTLKTGRTIDQGSEAAALAVGSRMAATSSLDPVVLRTATYILMSVPPAFADAVRPLADLARQGLAKTAEGASHAA